MVNRERIKLGILFGGRSEEHEISVSSASSMISALDPLQFQIRAVGITRSGQLASGEETRRMLPASLHKRIDGYGYSNPPATRIPIKSGRRHGAHADIFFPLLHGPFGEDGKIQGFLETMGVPYVGCGVLASAAGMDKDIMKRLFREAGLPVVPILVVRSLSVERNFRSIRSQVRNKLGYPVFSKPANLGSSIGIRKVHREKDLLAALLHSSQFGKKVVIEKGVECRELECAVLGNENPEASVVGEVVAASEFYDYDAKYHDPASRLEIPAALSRDVATRARSYAIKAFETIEGAGLARVDFFLERRTGKLWVNEINTMPGFTPISMYTKLWAATGLSFDDLVLRLVELGYARFKQNEVYHGGLRHS